MIHVVFKDASGTERSVPAEPGNTLMQTARDNGVPGIDAECGGCSACATCGVFVDSAWFGVVGPPGEIEASMLECCRAAGPESRLACQVVLTPAMDGLRVTTPDRQQ